MDGGGIEKLCHPGTMLCSRVDTVGTASGCGCKIPPTTPSIPLRGHYHDDHSWMKQGNTEEEEMSSQAETATQGDSVSRPSTTNFKSNLPEIRLSPWHLSSNFRNALAGKLILDLTGPADPSHCGAGFSFLRLPQRMAQAQRMFNLGPIAPPHPVPKVAPPPQDPPTTPSHDDSTQSGDPLPSHRHEIARIWQAQWRWLSDTTIPPKSAFPPSQSNHPIHGQHTLSLAITTIPRKSQRDPW